MSSNEITHTQGPWVVDAEPSADVDHPPALRIWGDEHRSCVAHVSTWHEDDNPEAPVQANANARLIAAAPDLLKVALALAELRPGTELPPELCNAAKTAVAKA